MALAGLGGGIGILSGSIGAWVFSHNRHGPYVRNRAIPVNPQSSRQNAVRNAVAFLSQVWSTILTATQRNEWEVYADNIIVTNRIGAQTKLTGFNWFIACNTAALQAGAPRIDDGPATLSKAPTDPTFAVVASEATQDISITFDNAQPWANQDNGRLLIGASLPRGNAVNFINGPFRNAGAIDGNLALPPTSPQVLTYPYPLAEGNQIVVTARVIEEDGRISDLFRDQVAAVA